MITGEAKARSWLEEKLGVPRETFDRLDRFADQLRRANTLHNLVSRSSIEHLWQRHVADSAQLLRFSPPRVAAWLDLGSGAGFPGLIVAALSPAAVTLVEPRRLRAEFLVQAADTLGVSERTRVVSCRIEQLPPERFEVITARAFAPLDRLFRLAHPFSTETTRWILPKGRSAQSELAAAQSAWQGNFRLEPSLTDDDSGIIIAQGVRPRGQGRSA